MGFFSMPAAAPRQPGTPPTRRLSTPSRPGNSSASRPATRYATRVALAGTTRPISEAVVIGESRQAPLVSVTTITQRPIASLMAAQAGDLALALREALGPGTLLEGSHGEDDPQIGPDGIACTVRFGQHRIRLVEVATPALGVSEMIGFTRQPSRELEMLRQGEAHQQLTYLGDCGVPVERIHATFRLASALAPLGLLGAIHVDAWQCLLPSALAELARADSRRELQDPALAELVLANLIPFHTDGGTWWTSKGHHALGMPDLTLWDDGKVDPQRVPGVMTNLVSYLRKGKILQPGERVMVGKDLKFSVGEVTEHREILCGPGTTLALRPA